MKKTRLLFISILSAATLCIVAGCVTANPEHATNPAAPAYVADQATISNAVVAAQGIVSSTAPFNPYAAPTNSLIAAVGGLAVGLSSLIATIKSKRKEATTDKVLTAVIAGVEAANDKATKEKIQAVATASGVETVLYNKVNS